MALDQNDIKLLTQALTAAIRAQGGEGQRWNAVTSRIRDDTGSPEERAAAIRAAKNMEDNNKLTKELANMLAQNTRSVTDLRRFTDAHTKIIHKAIDSYSDVEKSTAELTKQLNKQLSGNDANTQIIKKLAGNIDKLEHALSFADLGKHMSELSKSLDASSDHGADQIIHAVEQLETTIKRNGGNGVEDVSAELKKMVDEIKVLNQLTRRATQQDVNLGHAQNVGDDIRDTEQIDRLTQALKASNTHRVAQEHLRDLSLQAQTRGIEASIAVTKKSNSLGAVAHKRLSDWTTKVGTAAFVLDQLATAGRLLYNTIKTAGGTGTERSFGGVMSRDVNSLLHGVDPAAVQEAQQKDARTRAAFGRDNFDKSIMDGIGQLVGVTYDRAEALKMKSSTISTLSRSGIGADTANMTAASKGLINNFIKLQALTGMTGEQMASLNAEIAADTDYRQGLMTLSQSERAASVAGITQMFQEQALRNISIEQSKQMLKTQLALSEATSPKTRIKNAAKLKAMGGAVGIDMTDAADLVLASGNKELMKKRLLAKNPGMTEQQANARVANAGASREKFGTMAEKDLNDNGARGLMMESLLGATGTKDWALSAGQTLNEAGKMSKEAADKMMEAAVKMGDVNPFTNVIDFIGGGLKTIIGTIIGGAVLAMAGRLGLRLAPALAARAAPVLSSIAGRLGLGGAAAANAANAAGAGGAAANAASIRPAITNVAGSVGNVGGRFGPAANAGGIPPINSAGSVGNVGPVGGAASNAASIRPAITNVAGPISQVGEVGGAAANSAARGGLLNKAGGVLGAIAKPVAIAASLYAAGSALFDKDKNANEKAQGVGSAVGGGVGGWYGAGAGATLGAQAGAFLAPVTMGLSIPVGAALGGIAGGLGGSALGGWLGGKAGGAIVPGKTPVNPAIAANVNTAQGLATEALSQVQTPQQKKAAEQADPNIMLRKSIDAMNATLGQILLAVQDQNAIVSTDGNKSIALQQKLHRALKSNNFAGATPADGAGSTYKAG